MKNAEFIALLAANTNKTRNLRTFTGKWITGAARIPDNISTKIGHVVTLLQVMIQKDQICNRKEEALLVYNFQPILFNKNQLFCSLDMLVRPIHDIDRTFLKSGVPIQVIINGSTTEVCNCTKGLLDTGLLAPEEMEEGIEQPKVYGKYDDYPAVCSYIAISHQHAIESDPLFLGELNQRDFLLNCTAYDSFVEAREALVNATLPYHYIGELVYPKEMLPMLLKHGIGKDVIKIMNPQGQAIALSPNLDTLTKEVDPIDEIRLYDEALLESPTCFIRDDLGFSSDSL